MALPQLTELRIMSPEFGGTGTISLPQFSSSRNGTVHGPVRG
jgi:hypothetical protein